jgi:hypothetical protein
VKFEMAPDGKHSMRVLAAALAAVTPAAAQQMETETPPGDRWTVSVAPYLWIASMDGNATVGGVKSDVDVPFSDLLKDLSGGLMMAVDVVKGRFGIGLNGLFARVSSDADVGSTELDVTSDSGQLAVLPFYRLVQWQYGVSSSGKPLRLVVAPEAGFRLTYMRTELEIRRGPTVDSSENWADPPDRFAHRAGPHRPLGGHRRGQPRRLRRRLGLHLERPGLRRVPVQRVRAADHAASRLPRAVSGLSPPRLRVGCDHARTGHRYRDAVLTRASIARE